MSVDPVLRELLARCRADHHRWINGDASPYTLPEDGTIMGAVGGYGFGGPHTAERQAAVARQWKSGTGDVEFVNGGTSGDLAWLVMIERAHVVFDEAHGNQRWDLRVTEIFRRSDGIWERVHRHADPLTERHPLQHMAALLANGDR